MAAEAQVLSTQEKLADTTIEHVAIKNEAVAAAVADEHSQGAWEAILNNKRVVLWCVFFAFSGVAWYATENDPTCFLNNI